MNSKYIAIAKSNGFFLDRNVKNDILTSTQRPILYWIDEVGDKKKDIDRYRMEILPNFRIWFNNGVRTLGVGANYDLICAAQSANIKIDSDSVSCILAIARKYENIEQEDIEVIVGALERYKAKNIPINLELANRPMLYALPQEEVEVEIEKHL